MSITVGGVALIATNLMRLADVITNTQGMTEDKARALVLASFDLADAEWERAVAKFKEENGAEDQALRTMSGAPLKTADGTVEPKVNVETPQPAVAGPRTTKK